MQELITSKSLSLHTHTRYTMRSVVCATSSAGGQAATAPRSHLLTAGSPTTVAHTGHLLPLHAPPSRKTTRHPGIGQRRRNGAVHAPPSRKTTRQPGMRNGAAVALVQVEAYGSQPDRAERRDPSTARGWRPGEREHGGRGCRRLSFFWFSLA